MIVHLNGQLLPADQARISPFDRGFVFGDGVYEGLRSYTDAAGMTRIIGLGLHIKRMQAGLNEAGIGGGWEAGQLGAMSLELLKANGYGAGPDADECFIYWQVTRGTPPAGEPARSRVPPPNSRMQPTIFGYCSPQPKLASITTPPTKRAALIRDIRWEKGHLKAVSLIGNVMAALEAAGSGGDEAVMVRERKGVDLVTEGLATNLVLVVPGAGGRDEIVTPSLASVPILAGVTRSILLRESPDILERAVRAEELARAKEIMLIGTTTLVTSVTHLEGRPINDGVPGPVARRLLRVLLESIATGRDDC